MTMRIRPDDIAEIEADLATDHARDLGALTDRLAGRSVDADAVVEEVARFSVAAPSWAVGTGGTRFGRFPVGGEPRNVYEKIDDVAMLNSLTGANRTISLHIPWDDTDDPAALKQYAADRGIGFGAMNSN